MVTSADSQVKILCGVNVVCKFKGEYWFLCHSCYKELMTVSLWLKVSVVITMK